MTNQEILKHLDNVFKDRFAAYESLREMSKKVSTQAYLDVCRVMYEDSDKNQKILVLLRDILKGP